MSYPGEFDLNRPSAVPPEPPRRNWIWILLAVIAVAAIVAYVFWGRSSVDEQAEAPAAATEPAPATPPLGQGGEEVPLPPLGEMDATVRDTVGELSDAPAVASWLTADNLVRNFTAVVQNVADGRYPGRLLTMLRPSQPFQVVERDGQMYIDPRSYDRYDGIADAVTSLDPAAASRAYDTLKPRIQEAYRELGYPEDSVDRTLERAIIRLLETPVPSGDVRVVPKGATLYAYADPSLESLSDAQKLLIRTGPENARRIQAHLREIALALGIPGERLPSPTN